MATTIVVVAVPTMATGAQAKSPRALYKALLASVIPKSQLPAGFHSATTKAFRIGASPKRHHAVGEVAIDFDDGQKASIVYVVYPSRADALSNFADALKQLRTQKGTKIDPGPAGLPKPSILIHSSDQGLSFTTAFSVSGNVAINAISLRGRPEATRVAHLALKHLNTLR